MTKFTYRRRVSRTLAAWRILRGHSMVYGVRIALTRIEAPRGKTLCMSHIILDSTHLGITSSIDWEPGLKNPPKPSNGGR